MNQSRKSAPTIPAIHALPLVELVRRAQASPERLLAGVLSEPELMDPKARLSIAEANELVRRARELTGEPGLGFHLGLQMRVSAHGFMGFAAMAAANLGEAIDIAIRFGPTRTDALGMRLKRARGEASLEVEERCELGEARDVILIALVLGMAQIARALTGEALRSTAHLALPEPVYSQRLKHLYPGELRFGRRSTAISFDASLLALPLTQADPSGLRLAVEQCERELELLRREDPLVNRVRALLRAEGGGFPPLELVARRLHLAPRTLKRHLAARGTSFSILTDAQRLEKARVLLAQRELSIEEIAERLGYSDASNFSRAFRRLSGTTPGAARRTSASR